MKFASWGCSQFLFERLIGRSDLELGKEVIHARVFLDEYGSGGIQPRHLCCEMCTQGFVNNRAEHGSGWIGSSLEAKCLRGNRSGGPQRPRNAVHL